MIKLIQGSTSHLFHSVLYIIIMFFEIPCPAGELPLYSTAAYTECWTGVQVMCFLGFSLGRCLQNFDFNNVFISKEQYQRFCTGVGVYLCDRPMLSLTHPPHYKYSNPSLYNLPTSILTAQQKGQIFPIITDQFSSIWSEKMMKYEFLTH